MKKIKDEETTNTLSIKQGFAFGDVGGNEINHSDWEETNSNLIGKKIIAPSSCIAVGLNIRWENIQFAPEPVTRYAVYRASDGQLLANGQKYNKVDSGKCMEQLLFNTPVSLTAGEEYWVVLQEIIGRGGTLLMYPNTLQTDVEVRMSYSQDDPLPDTLIPTFGNRDFYISIIYE